MKTRIAIIVLMVGAFIVTGCAGVPVAVDHYGNMQQTIYQPAVDNTVIAGHEPKLAFPQYYFGSSLITFGLDNFQIGTNGIKPVLPYNADGSVTVFGSNDFQVKFMPMSRFD